MSNSIAELIKRAQEARAKQSPVTAAQPTTTTALATSATVALKAATKENVSLAEMLRKARTAANRDEKKVEKTLDKADERIGTIHEDAVIVSEQSIAFTAATKLKISDVYRDIASSLALDPSQRVAVDGLLSEQFGCIVGYAGTGKTTTLRTFVHEIFSSIPVYSVSTFGHLAESFLRTRLTEIPAIAFAAFTGRAAKQMAASLPSCFTPHCSTIHRLLGFKPEFYETDEYDAHGRLIGQRNTMRMIPTYTRLNRMPWRCIIIDEASMVGLDLWEYFIDAVHPDCRIYCVGDLSQLPPVFGDAIFGVTIDKWPTFELAKIHRQAEGSPIIANSARIRNGQKPERSDDGLFQIRSIDVNPQAALQQVVDFVKHEHAEKRYDPDLDILITPTNVGVIGQRVLNLGLQRYFNPKGVQIPISAGREKLKLAVGDRVMYNGKNNWRLGVTNGEIGVIKEISRNPDFTGVNPEDMDENSLASAGHATPASQVSFDFTGVSVGELSKITDSLVQQFISERESADEEESLEDDPDKRARQSSHVVRVFFPALDILVDLKQTGDVGALVHAYAITCHKSQGGQWRNVLISLHRESSGKLISREWLYTAVTRAREKCIIMTNVPGITTALERGEYPAGDASMKAKFLLRRAAEKGMLDKMVKLVPNRDKLAIRT